MEAKNLTGTGMGVILGAGLMYFFDPERNRDGAAAARTSGLQCLAGIVGLAAFAYGARFLARRVRPEDGSTATAFDLDVPNYAWLR